MSKTNESPQKTFIENFVLSSTSAILSHSAVFPYQRVRMLIRNQWRLKNHETQYRGLLDCAIKIFRNEGLTSFWKGNLLRCIRYFPEQSLNFAFKEEIRKTFKRQNQNGTHDLNFIKNFFSGSFAGVLSLFILHPFNIALDALITDRFYESYKMKRHYSGLIDIVKKKMVHRGLTGLYADIPIRLLGVIVYRGCYFGFYDSLKPIVLKPDANFFLSFLLAYAVTITSAGISYPVNALTIALRLTHGDGQGLRYTGIFDYLYQTVKRKGVIGLFKGARIHYTRCLIGAGVLAGFDKLSQIYMNAHQKFHST